jgi:methylated-DNA-protein-cysteine methyltransferase related protein
MPNFSSPPNPKEFNARVWEIVRQIPSGRVMAYGQVGALIPVPIGMSLKDYDAFKARWVGGAMAQCPNDVPWWRVINAQGKISERPGAREQRERLKAEGVVFDAKDKVDMKRFGWQGPDALEQRSLF